MSSLQSIAEQFYHAFYEKKWPGKPVPNFSGLTPEDSYQVQRLVAKLRVESGEQVIGYKVGCTSAAIQTQFGLDEPICGRLFAPHAKEEGAPVDWSDYVNCAIEPEMVIRIGRDIRIDELSDTELIDSIEYVSPGIEIHNYTFWQGSPSLQELICSGGIHAGLIVGHKRVPAGPLAFSDELFSVYKDDQLVAASPASEIMGGPLESLRWLARHLSARGEFLRKNTSVIPGSPTELIPIDRDTKLRVSIEQVGNVVTLFQTTNT